MAKIYDITWVKKSLIHLASLQPLAVSESAYFLVRPDFSSNALFDSYNFLFLDSMIIYLPEADNNNISIKLHTHRVTVQ